MHPLQSSPKLLWLPRISTPSVTSGMNAKPEAAHMYTEEWEQMGEGWNSDGSSKMIRAQGQA